MSTLDWRRLTEQAADPHTRPTVANQLIAAEAERDACRGRMGRLEMLAEHARLQGRERDALDAEGALREVQAQAATWAAAVVRLRRILAETAVEVRS